MNIKRSLISVAVVALSATLVACEDVPPAVDGAQELPANVDVVDRDLPVDRSVVVRQQARPMEPPARRVDAAPAPVIDDSDGAANEAVGTAPVLPAATPTAPNLSNGR